MRTRLFERGCERRLDIVLGVMKTLRYDRRREYDPTDTDAIGAASRAAPHRLPRRARPACQNARCDTTEHVLLSAACVEAYAWLNDRGAALKTHTLKSVRLVAGQNNEIVRGLVA
jgi:hypothetical protein